MKEIRREKECPLWRGLKVASIGKKSLRPYKESYERELWRAVSSAAPYEEFSHISRLLQDPREGRGAWLNVRSFGISKEPAEVPSHPLTVSLHSPFILPFLQHPSMHYLCSIYYTRLRLQRLFIPSDKVRFIPPFFQPFHLDWIFARLLRNFFIIRKWKRMVWFSAWTA